MSCLVFVVSVEDDPEEVLGRYGTAGTAAPDRTAPCYGGADVAEEGGEGVGGEQEEGHSAKVGGGCVVTLVWCIAILAE